MAAIKKTGILFVVLASVCWAIETVTAKFSFASVDFLKIVFQQSVYCFLTVFLFSVFSGSLKLNELKKLTRKDHSLILFIGITGSFLASLFFYYGISKTYAVNASLLVHAQPLFVAFLGLYFLKEKLNRNDLLGGFFMIVSAVLISSRTFGNLSSLRIFSFGDLMVLVSTFLWALVVIPAKHLLKKTSPAIIITIRFFISSLIFTALLLSLGRFGIFSVYGVGIGVITGFGYIFYYNGLKRLKATQTSIIELSAPFFAAVLAFFILGEILTILQLFGFILLALGIYFISKKEKI